MEQQEQANAVQLPMTPEATSAVLAVRYALDADFRAAFDKDPKAAVAKASGQELPSDLEIVVHRNEDKRWNITLPAMEAEGALGDQDIENVSGGVGAMAAMALTAAMPAIAAGVAAGIPADDVLAATQGGGGGGGVPGPMGAGIIASPVYAAAMIAKNRAGEG